MTARVRRARVARAAALILPLVCGLTLQGTATGRTSAAPAAPPADPTPVARSEKTVVHRVVWDEFVPSRGGLHLRTALLDGSGSKRLYDIRRGFTTQLTLDRLGRRVAFATCCRADLPKLVVVRLRDGKVVKPLARHPAFYAVGGIGWSPSGRRIAFEGFVQRGQTRTEALWTVRPDGTGLRRVIGLDGIHESWVFVNPALAWTRRGILYSDGVDLRVASAGSSQVLLPRVNWVRISGDGRHLVMERPGKQRLSIWTAAPDASNARRLFGWQAGPDAQGRYYRDVTPDFGGRRLLAYVDRRGWPSSKVVVWKVADGRSSGRVLDFLADDYVFAWN